MRRCILLLILLAFCAIITGCGRIDGPRFWWDDRNQKRLPDDFSLPENPGATENSNSDADSVSEKDTISNMDEAETSQTATNYDDYEVKEPEPGIKF